MSWVQAHLTLHGGRAAVIFQPLGGVVPLTSTADDVRLAIEITRSALYRVSLDVVVHIGSDEDGDRRMLIGTPNMRGFYCVATLPKPPHLIDPAALHALLDVAREVDRAMPGGKLWTVPEIDA